MNLKFRSFPVLLTFLLPGFLAVQATPLTTAIRLERFQEAQKLLTPELVNAKDSGLYHPLTYAVYTGNADFVEALLKAGADPNIVEHNGRTALYVAAILGDADMIRLLEKNGAVIADRGAENSPLGAAVVAGSLECLSLILELFPDLEVNAGWVPRRAVTYVHQSALNYAVFMGFNKIALLLLEKGASRVIPDTYQLEKVPLDRGLYVDVPLGSQNALHYAAANEQCSEELVQALVDAGFPTPYTIGHLQYFAGLSPTMFRQIPSSPIDRASVRGALGKVKIMTAGLDPVKFRPHLEHSALVAASWGRDECSDFLFGLINQSLARQSEILAGSQPPSMTGNEVTNVFSTDFLPRGKRSGEDGKKIQGKLAIIAPGLADLAALMTSFLSEEDGLELLERDELPAIFSEKKLEDFQPGTREGFHKSLDLIPAEHVLFLSGLSQEMVQASLVNTTSAVTVSLKAFPRESLNDLELLEGLSRQILRSASASGRESGPKAAISLGTINPSFKTTENLRLAYLLGSSLPFHISNEGGCVLLDRKEIDSLDTEKVIGMDGSYWASAWIVDGGIGILPSGKLELTLQASAPGNSEQHQITTLCDPKDFKEAIPRAWQELTATLFSVKSPAANSKGELAREAKLLAQSAQWLEKAAYYQEAIETARAAVILGRDDLTLKEVLLAGQLGLFERDFADLRLFEKMPRAMSLPRKLSFIRKIRGLQGLLNTAIELADMAGVEKSPRARQLLGRVLEVMGVIYPAMDDSLVRQSFPEDVEKLDILLPEMIKSHPRFFESPREARMMIKRLSRLLTSRAPNFYEGILKKIELLEDSKSKPGVPGLTYFDVISVVYRSHRARKPLTKWNAFFDRLQKSANDIERLCALEVRLLRTLDSKKRKTLAAAYRSAVAKEKVSREQSIFSRLVSERPTQVLPFHYIACEHDTSDGFLSDPIRCSLPPGGIKAGLFPVSKDLKSTAEFHRLFGLYVWESRLPLRSKDQWEYHLQKYRRVTDAGYDLAGKMTREDWLYLKEFVEGLGSGSKKTISQIDRFLDQVPEEKGHVDTLQAAHLHSVKAVAGGRYPAIVTFPRDSLLIGDELWLPFVAHRLDHLDRRQMNESQSGIEVIPLAGGTSRTVLLPGSCGFPSFSNLFPQRLIVTGQRVYYLFVEDDLKTRLFSIHRGNFEISEVSLPFPYLCSASRRPLDGKIFVSLRKTWNLDQTTDSIVCEVSQGAISRVLVSNKRKPPKSPFDRPNLTVTEIDISSGTLRLFSGSGPFIEYDVQSEEWIEPPSPSRKQRLKWHFAGKVFEEQRLRSKRILHKDETLFFLPEYSGSLLGKLGVYALPDLDEKMVPKHLESVDSAKVRQLHLGLAEVADVAFGTVTHRLVKIGSRNPKDRRAYRPEEIRHNLRDASAPNALIRQGLYEAHAIGVWKNEVILGLHHAGLGFPGVWKIKAKTIARQVLDPPPGKGLPLSPSRAGE